MRLRIPHRRRACDQPIRSFEGCRAVELLHQASAVTETVWVARAIAHAASWLPGLAALLACLALIDAGAQESPSTGAMTPPEVVERVDAVYPPAALAARQEGTVMLVVTVGADGSISDVSVQDSRGEMLDQAAIEAMKHWRFRPAHRGDEAIAARIRIPFLFALPASPAPSTTAQETPAPAPEQPAAAATETASDAAGNEAPIDVTVRGKARPASRGISDFQIDIGALAAVPRQNATDYLKLVPGVLLTNEGGEGHAEQVFLRGFDAREGQDIEFSVEGVPINESGNIHGNGYADTHFIIPELISYLRVIEGAYDPRQGNYAVAGSADYELGWGTPGITTKFSAGSFDTKRLLFVWGRGQPNSDTFAGVELYETKGFGESRSGDRARAMAQLAGDAGPHHYRLLASGYIASFHSAGVLREDDVLAGRKRFYSTYDPYEGEDASRISLSGQVVSRFGQLTLDNQAFLIARPIRFRENFTGFVLDHQTDLQRLHPQRGDLLDASSNQWTLGARGSARITSQFLNQTQSFENGYFLRGDFVSSQQSRIDAGSHHPYKIEIDEDSRLGDIGLYFDANLRPLSWLTLRGGMRGDLLTFDVTDNCAVHTVLHPSQSNPPGDTSCLNQEEMGIHREPFQKSSSFGLVYLPRGSILVGPFFGLTGTASYGKGVRSTDPVYVGQDLRTPFASARSREVGLGFERHLGFAELALKSVWFETKVDRDLIFSETAGRNIIGGSSTRVGSASSGRLTGTFFDLSANFTYVNATFDDDKLLIPYIPDRVLRFDGVVFGNLFADRVQPLGSPLRGLISTGITYVGPRPLPYGERSNEIFTVDLSASIGWWFIDFGFSATNLFNRQYRLSEFNYVSDFHTNPALPTLVPARHFSAGAPRTLLFTISVNLGGGK